jgi:hypothetical protein
MSKESQEMMSKLPSTAGRQWVNPLWVVVPASVIIFALGWSNIGGLTAALIGGVGGLLWALALAGIVRLIHRSDKLTGWLSTVVVLAAGATLFFMMGGGLYEYMLLLRALETTPEWIATLTSGPLAEQVILYFIIFNSLMELFLVPLALLLNWNMSGRRGFALAAVLMFYAIRIWTYLYFAPQYFNFGEAGFSQQLVNDLMTRISLDTLRFVVQIAEAILFFCVALVPPSPMLAENEQRHGRRLPAGT